MLVIFIHLTAIGPSLCISFLLSGLITMTTALVICELASRNPSSGSTYSYAYTTFGEFVGWIVGWSLNIRYGLSAGALSKGWSYYCLQFFVMIGLELPSWTHSLPVFD